MSCICETCGGGFEPKKTSRVGRFCSVRCYYDSGLARARETKNQKMRSLPGHPIAPPSGLVAVSRLVLYEKLGPGPHPCRWCGDDVDWKTGLVPGALLADHLNWDRHDDRPENLVASCNVCNHMRTRKRNRTRLTDSDLTVLWGGVRTRAVERFCNQCGESFLTIPAEVKKGKGRFCSRSCARQQSRRAA